METLTKTKWSIDPMHSEVQFKVKHLVISTVTGTFKKFEGFLESEDDNFNGAEASFSIDVASIDTNVADRDEHLKSDDFFNAQQYPEITFQGMLIHTEGDSYKLQGDLTIRNHTQSIELDTRFGGKMVDGYGQTKAGFEINGLINRKEFGLKWDMVTEAGGIVVGDDINLNLNIQVTLT